MVTTVVLLLGGPLGAAAPDGGPEGSASGRASDTEPNNSQGQAVELSSGEVVEGSLLTDPSNDYIDYYKISVPYGKVLNASLYMVDYDDANPGKYNFNLYLYVAGSYWYLDNSSTRNRWESVMGVQYINPAGPATMYLAIWYYSNQAGRYRISATVGDAAGYTGGDATGSLDENGPNGRAVYKLSPGPADDRRMLASLETPSTGYFSMHLYNIWSVDNGWYLHNASWLNVAGHTQQAIISGCGGTWYAVLKAMRGFGQYAFSLEDLGWALDGNNIPSKATPVGDNEARTEFVDQGADWVDWWKVEVKANRTMDEAYVSLVPGTYINYTYFNFSVFDRDLCYMKGSTFPYFSGPEAHLTNITVDYDGPVYFAMRANSTYSWGYSNFMSARAWYRLVVYLPNDPPVFNGPIPRVDILEDGSDDSVVLSRYFTDPDGNNLTYSILGGGLKTRPRINTTTGRINFTPEANWHGTELVRFRATDDGPGKRFADGNLTVVVSEVNDPPVVAGTVDDLTLVEDAPAAVTPDVAALFRDVDDPVANLSYALKITGCDTHPPNATLSIQYDGGSRTYRLGPARQFFGNYSLELTCTDRRAGTVPAAIRFNLTVTHRNHAPALSVGVKDPTVIDLSEGANNSALVVADLFSDVDAAPGYADDSLTFSVTGMSNLTVSITQNGRLFIDTGDHEYIPGRAHEERLLLAAKDRAGLKATLNVTVRITAVDDPPVIFSSQPEALVYKTSEGRKEVFRVSAGDPDTDTGALTYTWFLNDVWDRSQTGSSYQFQPDHRMGGTVHALRVVVSDGTSNATVEWYVDVKDVNRPPSVTIPQPVNYTKFKKGEFITFTAEARDEDGDDLTFTWRDGAGKQLGTGATMSTDRLEPGTQTVRLEVNDSKDSVYCDVVVMIAKPPAPASKGFISGFETAAALAAAAIAIVAIGRARRRGN